MFSLESIESLIGLITIVIAYFIVITISGYFRAWVALKMGDDIPDRMGFLKFSPLRHLDPIGFIVLIFFGFGWGRYIPIMPFNITGRFRRLKIFVANFSDVFANLAIATLCLVGLIMYFGADIFKMSAYQVSPFRMIFLDSLQVATNSHVFGLVKAIGVVKIELESIFPASSSLGISMVLITTATMYLSVLLAALNFIISGFGYVYMIFNGFTHERRYSSLSMLLIPMLLIFFFIHPLRLLVAQSIVFVATMLAKMIGFY